MREKLAAIAGKRLLFRAIFVRFGTRSAYRGLPPKTCLFRDVTRRGSVITDHIWFTCGAQFESLHLQAGDVVEFHARVTSYVKGYKGRRQDVDSRWELDYRLSNPTGVRKVTTESDQLRLFKE
jgi:hypothetical protein